MGLFLQVYLLPNIYASCYHVRLKSLNLLDYSGSGLSSSAAFVCSSTIAIMAVFGENFEKVLTQSCSDEISLSY